MKQDRGGHKKGDIVEIRASGSPRLISEQQHYVWVEVDEEPVKDFYHYNGPWKIQLQYEIQTHDEPTDVFNIRVWSETANQSLNKGFITKQMVQTYLTLWDAKIKSFATNEVIFDAGIYDAAISLGFWDDIKNYASIAWQELNYNPSTGVHRIEMDHSALPNNPTAMEHLVETRGGIVISHSSTKVLVYEIDRIAVRNEFQADVRQKLDDLVERRRYYVTEAVVDFIVGQGGYYFTDLATVATYIKDKIDD